MSTSSPLMFGYVESWSDLSLTDAAKAGYTGVILAFGTIDGTTVGVYQDSFTPDNGSDGTLDKSLLQADIKGALSAGASQVLISFGGSNNTYNPGSASASDVAAAVVTFLQTYGFTGCDFDIEIETDGSYLQDLISAIKSADSSLIVTAAPQLNVVDTSGTVAFVTTGTSTDYNDAISAGLFDYLLVQCYNSDTFTIDGYDETQVEFISAAFSYCTSLVPSNTLLAMGEPTTAAAAGASVYNSGSSSIYSDMAAQYSAIASETGFGGAMGWDVNYDEGNSYAFVDAIGPTICG